MTTTKNPQQRKNFYHVFLNGDWGSDTETLTFRELKQKLKDPGYKDDVRAVIKGGKRLSNSQVYFKF